MEGVGLRGVKACGVGCVVVNERCERGDCLIEFYGKRRILRGFSEQ